MNIVLSVLASIALIIMIVAAFGYLYEVGVSEKQGGK